MPLIVRYPKEIKAGSVNEALCSNVVLPLHYWIWLEGNTQAMQGFSLRSLLRGKNRPTGGKEFGTPTGLPVITIGRYAKA